MLEKHATKSGRSRTVHLSRQAREYLRTYLEQRGHKPPDSPLFPSQKDPRRPLSANVATRLIARIFGEAGVVNASSHSLRRTHANTLRRNGADLKLISEQLGHRSLATTDRYLGIDVVEKHRVVGRLRF